MTLLTKVLGGCCACLFYFATLSLSAQEAVSDTITGKVHQIDKVTVTARKLPNKITSAVPIQTLSQQDNWVYRIWLMLSVVLLVLM